MTDEKCPDHLTKTTVQQFMIFVKFLAANNLIDQAHDHLLSRGITHIWISLEPIKEIQKMIKHKVSQGVDLGDDAVLIALSKHAIDFESPGKKSE